MECMECLANSGFTDTGDKNGKTALMLAARDGRMDCLKRLLQMENLDVDKQCSDGTTSLILAAYNSNVECVKTLLDSGKVDVNKRNVDGDTALHMAVKDGYPESLECLDVLLQNEKADLNLQGEHGITLFMYAVWFGNVDLARRLMDTGKIDDINKTNDEGQTGLMLAAKHGRYECVQLLLSIGEVVDCINMQDKCGRTALMFASRNGYAQCVRCLMDTGKADVNLEEEGGHTALMLAAFSGSLACLDNILDSGQVGDINKKNKSYGYSAFDLSLGNDTDECRARLESTGKLDAYCSDEGYIETMRMTVKYDFNIDIRVECLY